MNFLDGSLEEQTKALKEFFGLRQDQSFQDIEIDDDDNNKIQCDKGIWNYSGAFLVREKFNFV